MGTVTDPTVFKSGPEFAAWIGLVPRPTFLVRQYAGSFFDVDCRSEEALGSARVILRGRMRIVPWMHVQILTATLRRHFSMISDATFASDATANGRIPFAYSDSIGMTG